MSSSTARCTTTARPDRSPSRCSVANPLLIAGTAWSVDDLAAVIEAARTLVRGVRPLEVDGREVAVPTIPHVWDLLEALDRPYDRNEERDPAMRPLTRARSDPAGRWRCLARGS